MRISSPKDHIADKMDTLSRQGVSCRLSLSEYVYRAIGAMGLIVGILGDCR